MSTEQDERILSALLSSGKRGRRFHLTCHHTGGDDGYERHACRSKSGASYTVEFSDSEGDAPPVKKAKKSAKPEKAVSCRMIFMIARMPASTRCQNRRPSV